MKKVNCETCKGFGKVKAEGKTRYYCFETICPTCRGEGYFHIKETENQEPSSSSAGETVSDPLQQAHVPIQSLIKRRPGRPPRQIESEA